MRIRSAVIGFVVALVLFAPASYALQEFTLEEAQSRIERLEARVASLEAMMCRVWWYSGTVRDAYHQWDHRYSTPRLRSFLCPRW